MPTGPRVQSAANPTSISVSRGEPDSGLDRVVGPVVGEIYEREGVERIRAASEDASGYGPGALLIHPGRQRSRIGPAREVIKKELRLREVSDDGAEEQEKPWSHAGECPDSDADRSSMKFMLDPGVVYQAFGKATTPAITDKLIGKSTEIHR